MRVTRCVKSWKVIEGWDESVITSCISSVTTVGGDTTVDSYINTHYVPRGTNENEARWKRGSFESTGCTRQTSVTRRPLQVFSLNNASSPSTNTDAYNQFIDLIISVVFEPSVGESFPMKTNAQIKARTRWKRESFSMEISRNCVSFNIQKVSKFVFRGFIFVLKTSRHVTTGTLRTESDSDYYRLQISIPIFITFSIIYNVLRKKLYLCTSIMINKIKVKRK